MARPSRRRVLDDLVDVVEDAGGYVADWRDLPRAVAQLIRDTYSAALDEERNDT